jgi:hypothetical protein
LNSWTFCFHLPCSWDYRHAPSCLDFYDRHFN